MHGFKSEVGNLGNLGKEFDTSSCQGCQHYQPWKRTPIANYERLYRRRNGREWIKRNLYFYWLQIHEPFKYKDIDSYTTRDVYIGNLKLDSGRQGGKWFRPANYREFKEYALGQLKRFKDLKYPAVYISQERYRGGEIEVRDLFIDVDFDENDPREAYKGIKFLDGKLRNQGIHILWSLSGNGIHGRLDMSPIYNMLEYEALEQLLQKSHIIYSNFVSFLEKYLINKGYRISFDKKIYSSRRLFRALYSPHESKEIIEIPIDLRYSLDTNYVLAKPEHAKIEGGFLGFVERPKEF